MSDLEEVYKMRLLQVVRLPNSKKRWMALVDGRNVSPSRSVTSTFTAPSVALAGARQMVDDQIRMLSEQRMADPAGAVRWAESSVLEAEGLLRSATRAVCRSSNRESAMKLRCAEMLRARVQHDLKEARRALAKQQGAAVPEHEPSQAEPLEDTSAPPASRTTPHPFGIHRTRDGTARVIMGSDIASYRPKAISERPDDA